jgi:hypothetical protein
VQGTAAFATQFRAIERRLQKLEFFQWDIFVFKCHVHHYKLGSGHNPGNSNHTLVL